MTTMKQGVALTGRNRTGAVQKGVFAPSLWGVNARESPDQIYQIAVISEYVSKFG